MRFFVTILFLFFTLSSATALAQEAATDFNIRVFGGEDTTPPTTPVLTLEALAETQVDVSWSTSTDNFVVAGYRVFRGVGSSTPTVIATTTQQFFSDTGLGASTTLSYLVQAFDSSFNYSSSSNVITVTTPAPPVFVPQEPGQATAARTVVEELTVDTGLSTAVIALETAFPSRIEFRWGRSDLYELGYVVSNVFKRKNNFYLDDLEPGTTYVYEIVGFTPAGIETLLDRGSFVTDKEQEVVPAPNVNRFAALADGADVTLSWSMPLEVEAEYVRIVRSYLDFPRFPTDGAIVYQGLGTEYVDEGILDTYSPVYYTAFLYDKAGSVSSGAIALVYALGEDGVVIDESEALTEDIEQSDSATSTINPARIQPGMKMPDPTEIIVQQGAVVYSMFDAPLEFNNRRLITVAIPADSVAGNLKSIIATLVDPTNNKRSYSFLLRINSDRTAYTGSFSNLGVVGRSQLKIELYDFEAYAVATYQTPIIFSEFSDQEEVVLFPDVFLGNINIMLLGLLFISLAFLLYLLAMRRASDTPASA